MAAADLEFVDHSGLDGEIVKVRRPGTGQATTSRSIATPHYSYPVAIRPTSDSNDQDIAHYLNVVSSICESAWSQLTEERVLRVSDVVRIMPVDGCYAGRPPEPRVTLSDVIAVILEESLLEQWERSGDRAERVERIIEVIQSVSSEMRANRTFRTYVLVYLAGTLETSGPDHPRNRLIAADFDLVRQPMDVSKELVERNHLLSVLGLLYTASTLAQAIERHRGEPPAPTTKSSAPCSPVLNLLENSPFSKFIVIVACFSALVVVASVLALLSGLVPDPSQGSIAIVGAVSGIALMFFGDLAGRLFEQSTD